MTQKYKKTIPPQFKTVFFPVSPMFYNPIYPISPMFYNPIYPISPMLYNQIYPISPMFFGLDLKTYAKIKKTTCLKRYCFCVKFGLPL